MLVVLVGQILGLTSWFSGYWGDVVLHGAPCVFHVRVLALINNMNYMNYFRVSDAWSVN